MMNSCQFTAKRECGRNRHGTEELTWLLDYELCSASRHHRSVTLVMISDSSGCLTVRMLENLMRKSDELFLLGEEALILMGETEKAGALKAVERYQQAFLGELDVRFALVSYPRDGEAMQSLLNTARRRLDLAQNAQTNAIISSG